MKTRSSQKLFNGETSLLRIILIGAFAVVFALCALSCANKPADSSPTDPQAAANDTSTSQTDTGIEPSKTPEAAETALITEPVPIAPTDRPTDEPSCVPTSDPTSEPTVQPTVEPTNELTAEPTAEPTEEPTPAPNEFEAVFLGVKGYGSVTISDLQKPGAKLYRFKVGNEEKLYSIRNIDNYSIQNLLMEDYKYLVSEEDGEIVSVRLINMPEPYTPVISGVPGKHTLKNFLTTLFMPLGKSLYVYGGGWNWQDDGSAVLATRIGVSGTWSAFYESQDANYLYKDKEHPESSFYPFGKFNEYNYAGLDCTGYVGWAVYNTLETADGQRGYVIWSTRMAKTYALDFGLGSWKNSFSASDLRPGDIVSLKGHVWVCLGTCSDGSIVILHSSPTDSVTGCKGGGVQMSALNPNGNSKDCEAYRLADKYQKKYFSNWSSRYPVVMKSYANYVNFTKTEETGLFHWDLENVLTDPDGLAGMSAAEVLRAIFGE